MILAGVSAAGQSPTLQVAGLAKCYSVTKILRAFEYLRHFHPRSLPNLVLLLLLVRCSTLSCLLLTTTRPLLKLLSCRSSLNRNLARLCPGLCRLWERYR